MKLLLCCCVVAILGIANESSAEINYDHQDGHCLQYKNYYENFYKKQYNKYYYNYWNNHWRNYYADTLHMPIVDLGNAEIDWVCTNPKTKEQWILGTQIINNNDERYYPEQGGPSGPPPKLLPPNFPPQHNHVPPKYPQSGHHYPQQGHHYPQSNQHPQQHPQPTFPMDQPNELQKPHHKEQNHKENNHKEKNNEGNLHKTPTTPQPQTTTINTNGEGLIDIRFGEGDE